MYILSVIAERASNFGEREIGIGVEDYVSLVIVLLCKTDDLK